MEWFTVYDFAVDRAQIAAMQRATRGPTDFGVSAVPALVGTPDWWLAIDRGQLPRFELQGTVNRVYWGSMGDWPEFELLADGGTSTTWTREGDPSRFVEGLRIRLLYTLHPWKMPKRLLGDGAKIVLRIELEQSDRRSDPRAPGPGGVGFRSR